MNISVSTKTKPKMCKIRTHTDNITPFTILVLPDISASRLFLLYSDYILCFGAVCWATERALGVYCHNS